MTNHIHTKLDQLAAEGRPGLMAHAVVGFPTVEHTIALGQALGRAGADFIELQIPFSDPLADGPSIRRASEIALAGGVKVRDAFTVAEKLSATVDAPLILMTYFNIVHNIGVAEFCLRAAKAGVSGLIVPDAPLEAAEREGLLAGCEDNGLHYIPTLAPTSTKDRIEVNAAVAPGLLYCMSRRGITGTQTGFDADLAEYLKRVRQCTDAPLAVGFGVSAPEHVHELAEVADVIVVGSAIIDVMTAAGPDQAVAAAERFVRPLAAACVVAQDKV